MCLTVPCRVLAVDGLRAKVARGAETLEVSLELFSGSIEPGQWVAVQAQRYVFARLTDQEAREIFDAYDRIGRELDGKPSFKVSAPADLPLPAQYAFDVGPEAAGRK